MLALAFGLSACAAAVQDGPRSRDLVRRRAEEWAR